MSLNNSKDLVTFLETEVMNFIIDLQSKPIAIEFVKYPVIKAANNFNFMGN